MREYTFKTDNKESRDAIADKMLEFVKDKKSYIHNDIRLKKKDKSEEYIVSLMISDSVPTFVSIKTDNDSKESDTPVVLMDTDFFPYELSIPNKTEISISWSEDVYKK
jgi:hypothetical protein